MACRSAAQTLRLSNVKLIWTRKANLRRKKIREYIELDNPVAALALDELFAVKAERLVDHPYLGRPGRIAGTRELVVHQNYILFYEVSGDTVRVLRIEHVARRWPPRDD